jgi:hypothetical protein
MLPIPQLLYHQLRETLLKCEELTEDAQLRALFVTEELSPFRDGLRAANNIATRVDLLIDYLCTCDHTDGQSILVLFIYLLGQRYHPSNAQHRKLRDLAEQLNVVAESTVTVDQPVIEQPAHSKIIRRFREYTALTLPAKPPAIRTIKVPMPQLASIETLLQDAKPVLITGGAGVGKSGIAYDLAHPVLANKGVLLLDARRLSTVEHLQGLRNHLELDEAIVDATGAVGHTVGCRLIIDQLDSVFETPSATVLCNLARSCARLPGVEVVVIARNLDRHSDISNELTEYGFMPITIEPLDEATSHQNLLALGIASPPPHLIRLGTNLLNLDLISRIQQEQPTTNFAAIDDEVLLWQYYLETIHAQERVSGNPQRANQMIDEAIRLAWEGLNTPERTITLPRDRTPAQQRLVAWELIHCEHGLIYSFRHEKLHEFLAAKDAVERNLSPKALMATINPHRTGSVVAWMGKLYVHAELRYRKRFITDYLAGENGLPFYTKLALLDRYIRSDISQEDLEIVRQILQAVEDDQGLRRNFFQAVPHYTWAAALWDYGFFDSPPLPIAGEEGRQFLKHWDVQRYLTAIASDAWEVVIRHVQSIEADGWYIRWAIEALCHVSPERAISLLPRILNWLEEPIIVQSINHPVYVLMLRFAHAKLEDAAFALFGAIITPILLPGSTRPEAREQQRIQPRLLDYDELFSQELPLLRSLNLIKLLRILEGRFRLLSALLAEHGHAMSYDDDWRSAIEDTDQDHNDRFADKLLVALRDSLETLVESDPLTAAPWIERYLADNRAIFRRLGLHLLAKFPDQYPQLVARALLDLQKLDDVASHHELFMLLHSGFTVLKPSEQRQLIALIQAGFSSETEQRYRQLFSRNDTIDLEEEVESRRQYWIRARLWMIREHLPEPIAARLADLVAQLGEPSHPEFLNWAGPMEWGKVQEISDFTEAQIIGVNADELVHQLLTWSPPPTQGFLRRISHEGLAGTIAQAVSADLSRYLEHSRKVAVLHPVFAKTILEHLANLDNVPSLPWPACIELLEFLLNEPDTFKIAVESQEFDWTEVRRAIIRLLERGVAEATMLPPALYPQVEAILFNLLDDEDPDFASDNPPANYAGHNDPLTIALNHVRPCALDLLIWYQVAQFQQEQEETTEATDRAALPKRHLPPAIADALTKRLDPAVESSWGVRAVFGRRLWTLYWLDAEWTTAHLDQILPEEDTPQSVRFFMAAWNTFVVSYSNCPDPQLLERLRPKYALGIDYLARGLVTKTLHPAQALARHLVVEYLQGAYAIDTPISQQNLLRKFYAVADPEACAQAAWAAWRFCAERSRSFWPRVKALWAWRLQEVAAASDPTIYKREIGYFARLPEVVYAAESMASLQALLTTTWSYLARSGPDYGAWEVFEEFLAHKVAEEPVAVIEFYQMMCDHQADPYRLRPNDTRRKILTVAAAQEVSRIAALALIDSIAQLGEHGYKDIYDRFAPIIQAHPGNVFLNK